MPKLYELKPLPEQNQKSFYGRACVIIYDDGTETLMSYDTPIIHKKADGTLFRLYTGYTRTTGKHIKAYCGLSKKEFESLPIDS